MELLQYILLLGLFFFTDADSKCAVKSTDTCKTCYYMFDNGILTTKCTKLTCPSASNPVKTGSTAPTGPTEGGGKRLKRSEECSTCEHTADAETAKVVIKGAKSLPKVCDPKSNPNPNNSKALTISVAISTFAIILLL